MKPNASFTHCAISRPDPFSPHPFGKRLQRAALLSGLTCLLGSTSVLAQDPWQEVDKLKPNPGISGVSSDVGVFGDSVFSVGTSRNASYSIDGAYSAVIRKSPDNGVNWREVDFYTEPGWTHSKYRAFGAGTNAHATLYAAGDLFRPLPENKWKSAWTVQKSNDGGEKWEPDEIWQKNDYEWDKTACFDIKVHPGNGDVYAVGCSITRGYSWEVRKKPAGLSSTWLADPVDTVGPKFFPTQAIAVAFDGNNILVVGLVDSGSGGLWTVRRSGDNGQSWATVDTFSDSSGTLSAAFGIAVGKPGVIYVCGRAGQVVKGKTVCNWAVRRSLNGGNTWTTVDRFGAQPAPSGIGDVVANSVVVSPVTGTVFVTGVTAPPGRLVVRKGTTSSSGAMTWTISDDKAASRGLGIAADASGNI